MAPVVKAGDHTAFSEWAVQELATNNRGNTAFMLIKNGEIIAEYYGQTKHQVDKDTLFPMASFSKWMAAFGVMSLVEQGRIELDVPAQNYLRRWSLPDSEFDNNGVTVRRLLSHTAGLTDRLGFGDYTADEVIPLLEDELNNPRASRGRSVKIAVGQSPGAEFIYSGGGYLILELLVEEVSGQQFADYMQDNILTPLGMTRSTYGFIGNLDNASQSFELDGSLAPTYQYASAAATSFASSASDLSKLINALATNKDQPVAPEKRLAMRQAEAFIMGEGIWGLGTMLYAKTPTGNFVYGHDGGNEPAINTTVRVNPDNNDAMILLVNGHPSLASSISGEWVLWQTGYPDFLSLEKILRSAVLPVVLGSVFIILFFIFWFRRQQKVMR
ncbi:MAG: serine hydrolase domain-containing protein [Pseudomonadota bacterium]